MPDRRKGGWGRCATCASPDRAAIEGAVMRGQPLREVAKLYGLSSSAIHRHMDRHRPGALARVTPSEVVQVTHDDTAGELAALLETAKAQLQSAGSVTQALGAVDTVLKVVVAIGAWQERQAARRPSSTVYLTQVPGYPEFRWALLQALEAHDWKHHRHTDDPYNTGHPSSAVSATESAREAVLDAIHQLRQQGDT